MSKYWEKTTAALWTLVFVWFAIAGLYAMMLWPYGIGVAIALCALPVFYLIVLILKKQYAFVTALHIISICGIIGSAFYLFIFATGGARIVFLLASPMMGTVGLMVVSLIFHILLMKGAGALRQETLFPMGTTAFSAGQTGQVLHSTNTAMPGDVYQAQEMPQYMASGDPIYAPVFPAEKQVHVTSILLGGLAVAGTISGFSYGAIGIVLGLIGLILSIRARKKYKTRIGMVLSIIGLALGAFFFADFIATLIMMYAISSAYG